MATTKVSALSAKTSLAGSEELLINDGGTSKKVTATNLLAGVSVADGSISTAKIADDAVTEAKLANAINTAIAANTAKTSNATHTGDVTGATELTIADDAVTAAKLANSINTDIATGVTGNTTANAALPKAGGAMTGAITTNSTFDGVDIATRDAVLTSTTTTANAALPKAGGAMTGAITNFTSTGINDDADATAITINSSENVGIGTTPESGQSANSQGLYVGTHASVISNGAYESVSVSENAYLGTAASDTWKYRDTSHAARHEMKAGVHTLKVAASGSADADITWSTALTAKSGGVVGAGYTDTDTSNTGSVTLDFAANQNFVLTLTGNVTLANPSTEAVGQSGFITFIQDGTGSRTVGLGTDYETAGGAGLTLTSTASATDIVPYVVVASGRILLGTPQLAFA
jgi:hypothetical protein